MAPSVEPGVVIVQPWPLFTAMDVDGTPLEGGRLWTYAANTTTEKATFSDRWLVNPNTVPVILDANGQATVWFAGTYHLRLETADGELLWDVPSYAFSTGAPEPEAGAPITGFADVTVTAPAGEGVILVPSLIPAGFRVEGCLVEVLTAFGTSNGVSELAVGDNVLLDRWGMCAITAGATILQQQWRAADRPIAATSYAFLISAIGGNYDAVGSLRIRGYFSSVPGWT